MRVGGPGCRELPGPADGLKSFAGLGMVRTLLRHSPPCFFLSPIFSAAWSTWRFDCCESQKAYHRKSGRYYAKAFSKPLPRRPTRLSREGTSLVTFARFRTPSNSKGEANVLPFHTQWQWENTVNTIGHLISRRSTPLFD